MRALHAACFLIACAALFWLPARAGAQPVPHAVTRVSNSHPDLGDGFAMELVITSEGQMGTVSSPSFTAPPGVVATRPSTSMQTETHIVNGVVSTESNFVYHWNLTAISSGKVVLPAPSAIVDGRRITGTPTTINVGGGAGGSLVDVDDGTTHADDEYGTVKELAMNKAPDDDIFIRAVADKHSAVVGEQVTVSFYVYYRVDFEMTARQEAPLADFLRVQLLADPSQTTQQITTVGSQRFGVRLIDKIAAFPLHAGELHVGQMSARFKGRRIGANVLRLSTDEVIAVTDTPDDGRPAGYAPGSVGRFALTATVAPRTLDQGGSLSVTLRLEGVGNLPSSIKMPLQPSVDWLDPEKKSGEAIRDAKVGGWRTFGYVATVKSAGRVDLGTVEVPFFDPATKTYEIARAPLGSIDVRPTSHEAAKSGDPADPDLLAKIPNARPDLGSFAPAAPHVLPGWALGTAIAFPPLLVVLGLGAGSLGGRWQKRRRATRESALTRARSALDDAKAAEKAGNVKDLASAVERAIHAAIEDAAQLKSRGIMRSALVADLTAAGIAPALAEEAHQVFDACETLRFAPSTDAAEMSGLHARARELVKKLGSQ